MPRAATSDTITVEYLTLAQAAAETGAHLRVVQRLVQAGRLPVLRLSPRLRLIRRSDLPLIRDRPKPGNPNLLTHKRLTAIPKKKEEQDLTMCRVSV